VNRFVSSARAKVDFQILFVKVQIDDAIALIGVERNVLDFVSQVRRRDGESGAEARKENQSRKETEHLISLAANVERETKLAASC